MITWYQIVQSEEYRQYLLYKEKLEKLTFDDGCINFYDINCFYY